MATLAPFYNQQFFTDAGAPVALGYLYTYVSGTTTDKATYQDQAQSTPNTNPIALDAAGRIPVAMWLGTGEYTFVLKTSGNVTIKSWDDVGGGTTFVANVFDYMTAAQRSDVRAYTYGQNVTTALATALAAVPASGGALCFPAGGYLGTMSIRRNNISLIGAGSSVTRIKHPNGALSTGGTIEVGDTASGNSATAYSGFDISGITIDSNRSGTTAVADDVHGHGMILTKISKWSIRDVSSINAQNAGIDVVIDSNYGNGSVYVENCGNATHTGPGFDINSSKYINVDVVSKDCQDGARVLDNCYGVNLRASVFNATRHGFIHQNQSANESHCNSFDVTVLGCGNHGSIIGENARNSNFILNIEDAGDCGVIISDASVAANQVSDSTFDITTRNSYNQGLLCYGLRNSIRFRSRLDGRVGSGGSYALDVYGDANTFDAAIYDSGGVVRSTYIRSGAEDNKFTSYYETGVLTSVVDGGTRTVLPRETYRAVAASTYTVAFDDAVVTVNNGATCTLTLPSASLTSPTWELTVRTIQAFTVVSASSNVVPLAGGAAGTAILAATAGKWATLRSDGTNWQIVASN